MKGISISARKSKSRRLQNLVAEELRKRTGLTKNDIHPALMGDSGIDIKLSEAARKVFPFGIECKNQEDLSFQSALKQAVLNAEKELLAPLLVFTRNRDEIYLCFPKDLYHLGTISMWWNYFVLRDLKKKLTIWDLTTALRVVSACDDIERKKLITLPQVYLCMFSDFLDFYFHDPFID